METTTVIARLRGGGGPEIEVYTSLGEIDLHNAADFLGLEYSSIGDLHLAWGATPPGNSLFLGRVPIKGFRLTFKKVNQFLVQVEDVTMGLGKDFGEYYAEDKEGELIKVNFCFDGGSVSISGCGGIEIQYDTV